MSDTYVKLHADVMCPIDVTNKATVVGHSFETMVHIPDAIEKAAVLGRADVTEGVMMTDHKELMPEPSVSQIGQ